jgi:hypothetical protein
MNLTSQMRPSIFLDAELFAGQGAEMVPDSGLTRFVDPLYPVPYELRRNVADNRWAKAG